MHQRYPSQHPQLGRGESFKRTPSPQTPKRFKYVLVRKNRLVTHYTLMSNASIIWLATFWNGMSSIQIGWYSFLQNVLAYTHSSFGNHHNDHHYSQPALCPLMDEILLSTTSQPPHLLLAD